MLRKILVVLGFFALFVILPVLIFTVLGSLRPKPKKIEVAEQFVNLTYETASRGEEQLFINTNGEVRPKTEINIAAQVAGKISYVSDSFQNGGNFNKGDVLVEIEDYDYKLALASAKAQVAQAEQLLKREEAEAKIAKWDWERLNGDKEVNELALRLPQLRQAKANYDAAIASLKTAELNLSRTKIKAPFNGRVKNKIADIGLFVGPSAPLGTIFSTDIAEVRLPLKNEDLNKIDLREIAAGNIEPKVIFSTNIGGVERKWEGKIKRIDSQIDRTTGLIYAIGEVETPFSLEKYDDQLLMGLFVDAKIYGKKLKDVIRLSRRALKAGNSVYVVNKESILEQRYPSIEDISDEGVFISAGIEDGERVVNSSLNGAIVGTKVNAYTEAELEEVNKKQREELEKQALAEAEKNKNKKKDKSSKGPTAKR